MLDISFEKNLNIIEEKPEIKIKQTYMFELYYIFILHCCKYQSKLVTIEFCEQYILYPLVGTTISLYNRSILSLVISLIIIRHVYQRFL